MRRLLALLALLLLPLAARGQSNPGWPAGFTPSVAQWMTELSSKADYNPNATSIGISTNTAPTAAYSGASYYATAPLTFTLPRSAYLYPTGSYSLNAAGGAVAIALAAPTDSLNGNTPGVGMTLAQGQWAIFRTDAVGNWRASVANASGGGGGVTARTVVGTVTTDVLTAATQIVYWDSTATAPKTETLPACTALNPNEVHTVADEAGTAYQYPITLQPPGGTTILEQSNFAISQNGAALTFGCDGVSNWTQLSAYGPWTTRTVIGTATTDTLATGTQVVYWDSIAAAPKTETLPACTAANLGEMHIVADDAMTAAAHPITLQPPGGTTILGQSSLAISQNGGSVIIGCDGVSNWAANSAYGGASVGSNNVVYLSQYGNTNADFQVADAAAAAAGEMLVINQSVAAMTTYAMTAPAISCLPGGMLQPASGATVTLSNVVSIPDNEQCFDGSAGGAVALHGPMGVHVHPQWWGYSAAIQTNMVPLQYAVNAACAVGGVVELPSNGGSSTPLALTPASGGTLFTLTTPASCTNGLTIIGSQDKGTYLETLDTGTADVFDMGSMLDTGAGQQVGIRLEKMDIIAGSRTGGYAITYEGTNRGLLQDVTIDTAFNGIRLPAATNNFIIRGGGIQSYSGHHGFFWDEPSYPTPTSCCMTIENWYITNGKNTPPAITGFTGTVASGSNAVTSLNQSPWLSNSDGPLPGASIADTAGDIPPGTFITGMTTTGFTLSQNATGNASGDAFSINIQDDMDWDGNTATLSLTNVFLNNAQYGGLVVMNTRERSAGVPQFLDASNLQAVADLSPVEVDSGNDYHFRGNFISQVPGNVSGVTGSIASGTLTVTAQTGGPPLTVGDGISCTGCTASDYITAYGGSPNTYTLNNADTVSSEAITYQPVPVNRSKGIVGTTGSACFMVNDDTAVGGHPTYRVSIDNTSVVYLCKDGGAYVDAFNVSFSAVVNAINKIASALYPGLDIGGDGGATLVDDASFGYYDSSVVAGYCIQIENSANNVTIGTNNYGNKANRNIGCTYGTINNLSDAPIYTSVSPAPNTVLNATCELDEANEGAAVTLSNGAIGDSCYPYEAKYGSSTAVVTVTGKTSDAPAGYVYSDKLTVTTAESSVGAGDYAGFLIPLSADQIMDGCFGNSGCYTSNSWCLSFWAKSSIGPYTFAAGIQNYSRAESYVMPFTISTAATWQYFSQCGMPAVNGTWPKTAAYTGAAYLTFTAAAGSTYQGSANTWTASNILATSAITNTILTTTNAYLEITNPKFEFSQIPTPFVRPKAPEILTNLQPWYQKSYATGTAIATHTLAGAVRLLEQATATIAAGDGFSVPTLAPMVCVTPTFTPYSTDAGTSGKVYSQGDAGDIAATISTPTNKGFTIAPSTGDAWTFVAGDYVGFQWTGDCRI
jgi:hypothetical protein